MIFCFSDDLVGQRSEEDSRRSEIAQILLENGADVNVKEPKGWQTPLHLASMNGFGETTRTLLQAPGINPNPLNKIFQTPLIYACMEEQETTVAELLKSPNINLEIPDEIHNQWNALHKAVLQVCQYYFLKKLEI